MYVSILVGEKQRRAIAEKRRKSEKFSTQTLIEELPLQAEFAMQETKQEWEDIINQYIKENMWTFKRVRRCTTSEHCDALGVFEQT